MDTQRPFWMARETPPRAWGRLCKRPGKLPAFGNTPTSVGKTPAPRSLCPPALKHPHERGEDELYFPQARLAKETPPRAWGRRMGYAGGSCREGNTPTSVGKTVTGAAMWPPLWKHPHERGEDYRSFTAPDARCETPPRAWGRRRLIQHFLPELGNTPTSVGKTWSGCPVRFPGQKHPHERGEDQYPSL